MRVIIGIYFFLISILSNAAELPANSLTGIYSDISFNKESGDLLGSEIFLMRGNNEFFVVFQSAQGVPSTPVLVTAKIKGNKLSFQLPKNDNAYSGLFEAVLYRDRLEGFFGDGQLAPNGKKKFILRKRMSYWQ